MLLNTTAASPPRARKMAAIAATGTEVKKIETWKDNLIQSELQASERKDRRAEDEFAALRARMTKEGK